MVWVCMAKAATIKEIEEEKKDDLAMIHLSPFVFAAPKLCLFVCLFRRGAGFLY